MSLTPFQSSMRKWQEREVQVGTKLTAIFRRALVLLYKQCCVAIIIIIAFKKKKTLMLINTLLLVEQIKKKELHKELKRQCLSIGVCIIKKSHRHMESGKTGCPNGKKVDPNHGVGAQWSPWLRLDMVEVTLLSKAAEHVLPLPIPSAATCGRKIHSRKEEIQGCCFWWHSHMFHRL